MNVIAELDVALLRQLHLRHAQENRLRFGGRLCAPVFLLSEAASRLGAWSSRSRTIELARALVYARPWPEVTDVLVHEMAHQYVDEVLGVRSETAHGETFRRVCAERGIDARAAGAAGGSSAPLEPDRVLERVRKLLALAGSPNQHEAEMAMRRAHELMLRHNIESAATRATVAFELRHLGDPTRRTSRVESEVVGLLARYFFVRAIRIPVYLARTGGHGWVFEIAGTLANVEMAVHVHGFLLATAARLWEENKGDRRVRSGRDRLSYQTGVIRGFHEKLALERLQLKGTGLVWVGDARLDDFYRARNPRVTRRRTSFRVTGAHQAGREAGQKIVINRPIEARSAAGGERKLLRG
jgi:hypothetical protein